MDLTPALVLAMWAAGIAAAASLVSYWRIVGSGYARLAGVVLVLAAGAAVAAGAGVAGWLAVAAGAAATALAGRRVPEIVLFAAAAVLLVASSLSDSPVVLLVSGSAFLGGITAEMMLGHWYLVDPQLPRWALQVLVVGAGAALVVDVAYLIAEGALDWATGDEILGWAFVVLSLLTATLAAGVSFALREPAYSGVMAATGLSYLAVLTAFGVVVLGRLLAF